MSKNGAKKHAVARRAPSGAMQRASAALGALEEQAVARLDLIEQRYVLALKSERASYDRIDQKLDQLREVLAGGGGVSDEREKHFLRRLEAMERYGRAEALPRETEEWVERDLAAEVPRGALSVASAWGISRDLVEQCYAQYQSAYEAAFRRWRAKYPDGVRKDFCFACGHPLPERREKPLPRMEER